MVILACIDGSDQSPKVIDTAITQARRWDADLSVIHVFQPPVTLYALDMGMALELDDLEESEREGVWERVSGLLDESGLPWTRIDRRGYPVAEITAAAEEIGADLIVIGCRGRGNLASLVLGSTSHGVIQHAPCDVLVVRG